MQIVHQVVDYPPHNGYYSAMNKRWSEAGIRAALADTPVVLLNGARQTGKTTLAKQICESIKGTYVTLDDSAILATALQDPAAFVRATAGPMVIDEVQKAPALLPAIKKAVDENRKPGGFLLTGSADVMSLPAISESLAGRIEILTLWPFSQGELRGVRERFVDHAFSDKPFKLRKLERVDIGELLLQGGYPEAVSRTQPERRAAWFASYVTTILQRDVRDLAQIDGLLEMPKLLSLLAARSSTLMNSAELSRASGIAQTTLKRYLALLQLTYLLRPLPPWSTNLSKRLIKTPKVHLVDAGLASYLAQRGSTRLDRSDMLFGNLLETFVVTELSKQAAWSEAKPALYHFRTAAGREVDVVMEGPAQQIVGIEVKASSSVNNGDFAGLRELSAIAKKKFVRGILLYDGDTLVPFGDDFVAMPIAGLWML